MPVKKALMYNFLSACTSFGGVILGIIMGELETSMYIFAFAGGLFLYVSLANLVSTKINIKVSVGIATDYGLDGPGIQSRWGRDLLHMSRPALGLTQPPVQWVPGLSQG
jgi:hypothetical protein